MRVAVWASLLLTPLFACAPQRAKIVNIVARQPAPAKPPSETARPQNPLDPLSAVEIQTIVSTLAAEGKTNAESRYPSVGLAEPDKAEVIAWKSGRPFSRRAAVVVKQKEQTFEAIVDVNAKKVLEWKEIAGVQPSILPEEFLGVTEIVKGDPDWQAAMRARGYDDVQGVVCMPLSVGYFGIAEEEGRRLLRAPCFDAAKTKNYWARPIEGLYALVDLNERKVVKVIDRGIVPVPDAPADYSPDGVGKLREPLPPMNVELPQGAGFTVRGHEVEWQNWRFHMRNDTRAGLVVSQVRYEDGGRERSVLYEGNVAELFVPYMDPDVGWFFRTYMDMGEYGVGKLATSLVPGADCPRYAAYFGDAIADDHGAPIERPRIACLFEREAGEIAWRHYDFLSDETESRPARELVARLVAAIGNYDYVFDWVFRQDGTIKVAVGATGIAEVKGVTAKNAAEKGADAYGRFVAERTVAVNHDHFFSYRLDFDVDGTENSFVVDKLVSEKPKEGPRRSVWVVESKTLDHEQDAQLHVSMSPPTSWRVVNPKVRGPGGYPVGFELRPGHTAMSLLDPEDYPAKRAAFVEKSLWVTPYAADERWASGEYPNQSKGGDGLLRWTSENRRIDDRDLVLWYTLGFHHVVRAEDWPVLPTSWHEFEIRPVNFFARSPALDLPVPR